MLAPSHVCFTHHQTCGREEQLSLAEYEHHKNENQSAGGLDCPRSSTALISSILGVRAGEEKRELEARMLSNPVIPEMNYSISCLEELSHLGEKVGIAIVLI